MQLESTVTINLINKWQNGDTNALNKLINHTYSDLNRIASTLMLNERKDHTLTPKALISELYIQMVSRDYSEIKDRIHFLSLSALIFRRTLISYARKKNAIKRSLMPSEISVEALNETYLSPNSENQAINLLALEKALVQLHSMDSEACHIIELRIFAGFTVAEIAQKLDKTERTIYRRWSWAQNWLYKQLNNYS